jgi:ribonuclease Z
VFFTQTGTQRMSGMPGMGSATGALFNPKIILRLRSLDVHGRRWGLEPPSRWPPRTHPRIGRPPSLRLSVRPYISHRALLSTLLSSQSLGVTPVEVESISPPTGTVKPRPTYIDENITVYSIPLFPEVDEDGNPIPSSPQEGSSSKRKRWASSPSPPRRNRDEEFSAETKDLPLEERRRLNGFLPTNLAGKDAEQWREMTIKGMFPAMNTKSGRGAGKGVDADPPYVSRRHPGSFNPAGSDKQLPRMNFTKDSEPITSKQKPALAYVVIGPKTRGKFDAKKADELGLKGKLRGLVANGTTVTFTTTDACGKQIERTVKPEECVGPGDNPAVCAGFTQFFSPSSK